MGFWERTWQERGEEVRRAFGDTDPPGMVTPFSFADTRLPGACAMVFPPTRGSHGDIAQRDHWLTLTLGLTQPLDREQVLRERAAGKQYSAHGFELGIVTTGRGEWASEALRLYLTHIAEGLVLQWGDRFAFGFHETTEGELGVFTGRPEVAGVRAVGDIRAMLFWKYLFPRSSFVTSTGNAIILIGTGITEDEWEAAKATTTAHMMLLLGRANVGQRTDPFRKSLLKDARWAAEWQRIKMLTGEQVFEELQAGADRWNKSG